MHCVGSLVVLLFPSLLSVNAASGKCVDFWTTQHAGSASLTVQFQHSCYTGDFLELVIIANVAGTGQPGDNCQFVHDSGRCTETLHTYTCSCDDSNNTYTIIFTEAIDRSTNEWEVTGKLAMSKQEIKERVTLRRRDAARVEDIAITVKGSRGQPVEQGDNVTLTCTWDRGNPPHTAAIFDERNRRFVPHVITSGDDGQLEHVIHDVQCKDSGLFRCEAAGASVNKSIVLLVKCPPTFPPPQQTFSALSGADLTADFMMRAHTDTVSSWTLQQLPPNNTDDLTQHTDIRSRSALQIQGTPPSLTARLTLRDVTATDEGRWRLEVANDVGDDHVDFQLTVSQGLGAPFSYGVLGIVCTLLVLVLASVVVIFYCCRKAAGAPPNTAIIELPPSPPTRPPLDLRPSPTDGEDPYAEIINDEDDAAGAPPNTAIIELPPSQPTRPPLDLRPLRPSPTDGEGPYAEIINDEDDDQSIVGLPTSDPNPCSGPEHHLHPLNISLPSSPSPSSSAQQSDVSSLHPSSTSQSSSHSNSSLGRSPDGDPDGYLHPTASAAEKSS